MGKIIVDNRYLEIAKDKFGEKHEIIPSFTCENLQKPVCAHPDMTILPIEDIFVCSPSSYEYYRSVLGDRVKCGATKLSNHYPNDIAYNVLIFENLAFGKEEFIDSVVKCELRKRNIKIVNINQGYAKCSSCITKNGIITADNSIYKALVKNNIAALNILPGFVKLFGYEYGFIGGASGEIDGELTFFGDITKHPDFEKIDNFCKFKYFSDFPLTDIGTILYLN